MIPQFDLLLISPESEYTGEIGLVIQLFNRCLSAYHLRKPNWSKEELQQWIGLLPKEFHNRIVLHSHFELVEEFELKGIHLNEKNKPLATQWPVYNIVSASFHSLEDLKANSLPYQYVFLSPIFDSISKVDYKGNFDLQLLAEGLRELRGQNLSTPKVIGLGGVNAQNILLLKNAGFSGAAMLGAVWQNENPVNAFVQIQATVSEKP